MPIRLDAPALRAIFPRAPKAVIDAFVEHHDVLDKAGITHTKTRLAYAFANVEAESAGFTRMVENINYSHERMAEVWPNRFASADAVRAKYGTAPGWQLRAFNDIYGNRMGNRPGTADGSAYIGRGGVQLTGREAYEEIGRRTGLDLVNRPEMAALPEHQPAILAAFWSWKGLNRFADKADFVGCVKAWNGGTNGMADRREAMKGNDPIIARMEIARAIDPIIPDRPDTDPPHGEQSRDIQDVQTLLVMFGYHEVGKIDGKWGGRTAGGIAAFKNDRHMDGPPVIDDALRAEISRAKAEGFKRSIAPERSAASEKTVAKEAPELVPVQRSRLGALWASIGSMFIAFMSAIADYFHDALAWVVGLKGHAADTPGWVWFVIAGVLAGIMYLLARNGAAGIVKAFRKGERA